MRRSAFTLVELLVVISIIVLLIAILLPSMKTSKWITIRTVCAARLHHFSHAMLTYSNDANGDFPPASVDQSNGGHVTVSMDPWLRESLVEHYMMPYEAMFCPTLDDTDDGFWGHLPGYDVWRIGYSVTTGYRPYPWPWDGQFGFPNPVPSSAMTSMDPPDKVILADSNLRANGKPQGVWGVVAWATRLTSHRPYGADEPEGGHSVFVDGHVKWFAAREMGPYGDGINTGFGNYDYGFGFPWGTQGRDTFWGVEP